AIGASFLAAGGLPSLDILGKIVLAVVCARTAAMAFNRWLDRDIDADNPRTRDRAIPAGALSPAFVALATVVSLGGFVACAAWINPLALKLSPIVVVVLLGYSWTKRFTALCHLVLGAALGLAPVGAWVAVRGSLAWEPWVLGVAVLLWTAGFDVLYACMDFEFDRGRGLHSIPARFGVRGALRIAALLHGGMAIALLVLGVGGELGSFFLGAVGLVIALLIFEHRLVRPDDLSRVNRAFFTMNGVISVLLMLSMILTALRS
ncbi:MAG: putative 4-hydroxybenzoate polyprenyltransferase, partial [Planctomycetes bacterium]|nr:putative 4-hydroxybenzoate polyprenyltransferase [Planctomycetota bacterium]